jgi:hypothetical protein
MKMMKYILILLTVTFNNLYSQTKDYNELLGKYNPHLLEISDFNNDSLVFYFSIVLNEYRDSLGLQRVEIDESLKVLAVEQTNYNKGTKQITHIQKNPKKRAHWDRAQFYGLPYDGWNLSECLMIGSESPPNYLKKHFFDIYGDYNLNLMIAKSYLYTWKNSPGHNKVLINPSFNIFYIYRDSDECNNFGDDSFSYTTLMMAEKQ